MASFEDRTLKAPAALDTFVRPIPVPRGLRGQVVSAQLGSVSKLAGVIVTGNLVTGTLVLFAFSRFPDQQQLLGLWGTALFLMCAVYFLNSLTPSPRRSLPAPSERIGQAVRAALIMGVVWGALPLLMMTQADPGGQSLLSALLMGMIFGGGFVLSRVPEAAYAFILPITAGLVGGLQGVPGVQADYFSIIIVIYGAVICISVHWSYTVFVSQLLDQNAVTQQQQLISLLLRDFEESSSDWLWQTDPAGTLVELPMEFDGLKSGYQMMACGQDLLGLFEPGEARTVLAACLKSKQGFRDLILQVPLPEGDCWWSLTGKPIYQDGVFRGFRGVASDVTQSKEIEDRIAYLAHFDGLTGLPNRASFHERLERACRTPAARHRTRAVVWIDLDNFKWVNDTLGHPAGDELLRQFARRLTEACEDGDAIARLGGDEFALIVERDDTGALPEFLDRLSEVLARPYDIWGSTAQCSASLGVRRFDATAREPNQLLTHADLALYQAKRRKGGWVEFSDELERKARARRAIEADLHRALEEGELELNFQPIVEAATGRVLSCETLLRWNHPVRGLIMPGDFIEHAEDSGLISRLGEWVIREALREIGSLDDEVRVAINISPLQLHSASLMSTVVQALAANGLSPDRLELEITESILLADTGFVHDRLSAFRELGVRISLDDFGTGFSSLSYLRTFPVDKIKIDKSFVSDLETNEDSRVITEATIGLAKALGMRVTAEGVESAFQRDYLRHLGCDELQGFLISRARPLADLRQVLSRYPTGASAETDEVSGSTAPHLRAIRGRAG